MGFQKLFASSWWGCGIRWFRVLGPWEFLGIGWFGKESLSFPRYELRKSELWLCYPKHSWGWIKWLNCMWYHKVLWLKALKKAQQVNELNYSFLSLEEVMGRYVHDELECHSHISYQCVWSYEFWLREGRQVFESSSPQEWEIDKRDPKLACELQTEWDCNFFLP